MVRRALERLCCVAGVRVVMAVGPANAIHRARHPQRIFDLAILDIELGDPKRNGVDLGAWLQSRGHARRVVFYSAQQNERVYLQAVRLGDYVVKDGRDGIARLMAILDEIRDRRGGR